MDSVTAVELKLDGKRYLYIDASYCRDCGLWGWWPVKGDELVAMVHDGVPEGYVLSCKHHIKKREAAGLESIWTRSLKLNFAWMAYYQCQEDGAAHLVAIVGGARENY
jgi:hypothetical protein